MSQEEHYLKRELYQLVRNDPAIFEFLQAGSLDGIWYWDVERQDQEWMSPRFKELFGYRDDEIPNTSEWWQANIFPEDRDVALDNFARHLADPDHPYDQIVRYRHRDGSSVWVRCRGLAVRNDRGEPIRLLGCHTDVTALKRAEEDLRRQTAELRDARDAAERANRAKGTFLANVSHEIRTPLNAVIGTAELLGDTGLTPVQHDHLDAIRESAEALLDIINDILDFSKIEADKLRSEQRPFLLRDRVGNLVKSLAPRLHGRPVAMRSDVARDAPDALLGDARLLRQVLANLLSNAIKFTEQGAITLRVRVNALTDDTVTLRFEVADTGIGIPPDKQRVIFEEFVQADASTTRRYGGTGLGLAIASRLVDALGGAIGLESEPGTGSTFHFTARFGLDTAPPAEAPPPPEPDVELRPLHVLLVEDSVANQRVGAGMLEKLRHTVRIVTNGAAAVEACAAERFDVILMDLQMPGMDGYEATRTIRRREHEGGAAKTPIVALTARASSGNEELCLAAGFDGYLAKPYRRRELLEAIAAVVPAAGPGPVPAAPPAVSATGARLDWDAALETVDGDRELLARMIEGFVGQEPALVSELREAFRADDLPAVQRVAHTIGGSLRSFDGARVVALANDLEDRCREGAAEAAAAAWRALEPELADVMVELGNRVGRPR
jgi:PAS domain S-box-containing protein